MNNRIAELISQEAAPTQAPPFTTAAFAMVPVAGDPSLCMQQFYAAALSQAQQQASEMRRPRLLNLECWN